MNELKFSKRKQTGRNTIDVKEFKAITGNEASLQKQCEEWLTANQIQFIRIPEEVTKLCSPTHPARVSQHVKNMISKYFLGISDLVILLKDGRYLAVELKSKKGRLTQGQRRFASRIKELFVIRSYDDFIKLMEKQ